MVRAVVYTARRLSHGRGQASGTRGPELTAADRPESPTDPHCLSVHTNPHGERNSLLPQLARMHSHAAFARKDPLPGLAQ